MLLLSLDTGTSTTNKNNHFHAAFLLLLFKLFICSACRTYCKYEKIISLLLQVRATILTIAQTVFLCQLHYNKRKTMYFSKQTINLFDFIVNDIKNFVFGLAEATVYGSCKSRKQKFVMSFTIIYKNQRGSMRQMAAASRAGLLGL